MLVWLMVELMVDELSGGIVAGSLMDFRRAPGRPPILSPIHAQYH